MSDEIDYAAVELPRENDFETWGQAERRAFVLKRIQQLGNPAALNQSAVARQFDVSRSTIHYDVDAVADQFAQTPVARRDLYTETVFRNSVEELQAEGEHYKAAKVAKMWSDWLMDRGKVDQAAQKQELDISASGTETDAIRIVDEDGVPLSESENGW